MSIAGKQPGSITREPLAYPGYITKDGWFDGEPETPHEYLQGFAFNLGGNKRVAYVDLGGYGFGVCEAVAGGGKDGIRHIETCAEGSMAEQIARRHLGELVGITKEPGSAGEKPSNEMLTNSKQPVVAGGRTSKQEAGDSGSQAAGDAIHAPGTKGSSAEPEVEHEGRAAGQRESTMEPANVEVKKSAEGWYRPAYFENINKSMDGGGISHVPTQQGVQTPGSHGGNFHYSKTGKIVYDTGVTSTGKQIAAPNSNAYGTTPEADTDWKEKQQANQRHMLTQHQGWTPGEHEEASDYHDHMADHHWEQYRSSDGDDAQAHFKASQAHRRAANQHEAAAGNQRSYIDRVMHKHERDQVLNKSMAGPLASNVFAHAVSILKGVTSRVTGSVGSAGPGSRGGHVIGYTHSGKPIYTPQGIDSQGAARNHVASLSGWSDKDHLDASLAHSRAGAAIFGKDSKDRTGAEKQQLAVHGRMADEHYARHMGWYGHQKDAAPEAQA